MEYHFVCGSFIEGIHPKGRLETDCATTVAFWARACSSLRRERESSFLLIDASLPPDDGLPTAPSGHPASVLREWLVPRHNRCSEFCSPSREDNLAASRFSEPNATDIVDPAALRRNREDWFPLACKQNPYGVPRFKACLTKQARPPFQGQPISSRRASSPSVSPVSVRSFATCGRAGFPVSRSGLGDSATARLGTHEYRRPRRHRRRR